MALVTRELNQGDQTRMLQEEFPEIPEHVIFSILQKNNGNLQLARLALETVSERYLFGHGEQTPSPTSPQSPIRYPLQMNTNMTYTSGQISGSPNRSRTPSTPSTPGTPTMDPFMALNLSGRSSPSPRTIPQYQHISNQAKQGSYANMANSPARKYVSQLEVLMDRQPGQSSSRPPSGSDQDGQLINGMSSASSGPGTPTRTPTMTPLQFSASSLAGTPNMHDEFPTQDDFPTQDCLSIESHPSPGERRVSSGNSRYPGNNRNFTEIYPQSPSNHRPTLPSDSYHMTYERHPIDNYPYPVERWHIPDHQQDRVINVGVPINPRTNPQYHPHPYQPSPRGHLPISQSVPNLEGHKFCPVTSRESPQIRHAISSHNVSLDQNCPLTPTAVLKPEVVTSTQVIPPSPHSPARPVSSSRTTPRPRSESYDPRVDYDATRNLILPTDVVPEKKRSERVIPVAWQNPGIGVPDTCFSLPAVKHGAEEDGYTQALLLHQQARYDKLIRDLNDEKTKLEHYRRLVADMELQLTHKSIQRSPFPTVEQVHKLREEKRQYQIDIECMNREIELHKSQGLISQAQRNNFYANMQSTGPSGPMPPKRQNQPASEVMSESHPTPTLEHDEGQHWSCTSCTFLNHPALDKCECCEMPRM